MSETNNLIDLSADETLNTTNILEIPPSPILNINPSNNIPSIPILHQNSIPLRPGKFITSDARNSLDNNPFDSVQKEANLQDDPFEMFFREIDISSNNTSNRKNEVVTENLLLLCDDNGKYNLNIPKVPSFSRLGSTNSNGQLSSVSSICSTNSVFSENISSIKDEISSTLNTGFLTENSIRTSGLDNIELSEVSELNKGFLITKHIFNSTEKNVDPTVVFENDTKTATGTLLHLNDDSNKVDFLNISKFNRLGSTGGQLSSVSSMGSINSPYKFSTDMISQSASLQKDDSSTFNKKFIADNTDELAKSQLNKGFITSQNTLNLSENTNLQSKENILKNIYATPDGQSTPNNSKLRNSSSGSSISSQSIQLKCHKYDLRNRLLKLSISNSSINSPLASCRRSSKTSDDCSSLELSVFNEASNLAELYSQLITSSPSNISEDSCDDLMSIKPNWIDSRSDIENDLELLKIPILEEIDSSKNNKRNNSNGNENNILNTTPIKNHNSLKHETDTEQITSNLDKLKEKIKQHKIKNTTEDINALINGLKGLIFECTQDEKKDEASSLLESLSCLMGDNINKSDNKLKDHIANQSYKNMNKIHNENTNDNLLVPKPIIRQGTFDLDLKDDGVLPDADDEIQDNIDQSNNDDNSQQDIQPELVDIVEQIGKLLGGKQNVNIVTTNLKQNTTNGQLLNTNPTYIVVMGTPSKRKISNNENSPNNQTQMRRRSQSLSLHDKRLKLPTGNATTSRINTTNHATSPIKECSTPIRSNYIARRNSISTTTITPVRRSMYAQTTVPKTQTINQKTVMPNIQRRSMLVETAGNNPSKPIVNFRNDFNTKQLKFKTANNNESTVRNKGPLKATIPIKRVPPLIVTSSENSDARHIYNKPLTSTPVAVTTKLSNNRGFPKACSTPTVVVTSSTTDLISPTRNTLKNRMRYSYVPSTPNLSVQSSTVGQRLRRRSFTESKSPKNSQFDHKDLTKTLKNFKFGNRAAASKPNIPTTLNKENKQPRFGVETKYSS